MADSALTFEYKPSLRGQTILTAKLGENVLYTDKLDISRAERRKGFITAAFKGRRGFAKYRKNALAELFGCTLITAKKRLIAVPVILLLSLV